MLPIFLNFFRILIFFYIVFGNETDKKCLNGVCTYVLQCPTAVENIRNGIFPKICGYEDQSSEPTICCTDPLINSSTEFHFTDFTTENIDIVNFPGEKPEISNFEKRCKEYALKTCDGSLSVATGVLENYPKRFPHTALIGFGEFQNVKWKCSGSLISEFYVLTVARCEYTSYGYAQWVRLGTGTSTKTSNFEYYEIVQRLVHPEYHHPYLQNDIALFKLNEKVQFNAHVHPICLFDEAEVKQDKLFNIGFSKENCIDPYCNIQTTDDLQTDKLIATETVIKDHRSCEIIFQDYEELVKGTDEKSSMCAGLTQSFFEECQGAVGDSLLYEINTGCPYFYKLVGISSTINHSSNEFSCYFLNTTIIYTKVSHYLPWIEQIVWKRSRD